MMLKWMLMTVSALLMGLSMKADSPEQPPRIWDLEEARAILAASREPGVGPEKKARALLTVAELLRLDYEALPKSEREERRKLGEEIDALAQSGENYLGEIEESSERERLRADLFWLLKSAPPSAPRSTVSPKSRRGKSSRVGPRKRRGLGHLRQTLPLRRRRAWR